MYTIYKNKVAGLCFIILILLTTSCNGKLEMDRGQSPISGDNGGNNDEDDKKEEKKQIIVMMKKLNLFMLLYTMAKEIA